MTRTIRHCPTVLSIYCLRPRARRCDHRFQRCGSWFELSLYSDAPGPFPGGDPRNDYFTGGPDQTAIGGAPTTNPGHGANTRTLMKITVAEGAGDIVGTHTWLRQINTQLRTSFLNGTQPGLLFNNGDPSRGAFPFYGVPDRLLTLNEDFDEFGRLIPDDRNCPPEWQQQPGSAHLGTSVSGCHHREPESRGYGGLADYESHGRYASDSFPPGQRAGNPAASIYGSARQLDLLGRSDAARSERAGLEGNGEDESG